MLLFYILTIKNEKGLISNNFLSLIYCTLRRLYEVDLEKTCHFER